MFMPMLIQTSITNVDGIKPSYLRYTRSMTSNHIFFEWLFLKSHVFLEFAYPYHPCMGYYLPQFGGFVLVNVGKYIIYHTWMLLRIGFGVRGEFPQFFIDFLHQPQPQKSHGNLLAGSLNKKPTYPPSYRKLGGVFKYFYFRPYLGKISNLTNIFQMG